MCAQPAAILVSIAHAAATDVAIKVLTKHQQQIRGVLRLPLGCIAWVVNVLIAMLRHACMQPNAPRQPARSHIMCLDAFGKLSRI